MVISPLAKSVNDKATFDKMSKWVSIHNELNNLAATPKEKPKNPKIDINVKIDDKKLDKQINAEIDKVMSKYFKKK